MKPLKSYIKQAPSKSKSSVTSVHITKEQKDFLEKHNINLSQFVRDQIDQLIKESNK